MSIARIVVIISALVLGAATLPAQQRPHACVPPDALVQAADSAARFRTALTRFIHETLDSVAAVPGVSVAVVRGGEALLTCGFGMADAESGRGLSPSTPIYIASNTKPFVGLLAAVLAERGLIALEAPMTRYLRDVEFSAAVQADSVTLRHLLTHTAGLSNDAIVFRTAYTGDHDTRVLRELLAATAVRDGTPRGTFGYTNLGYVIAGLIIEQATGRSWKDELDTQVLQPLGMHATTARTSRMDTLAHPPAVAYRATGASTRKRVYLAKTDATMHAAGGLLSTTLDLRRWLQAVARAGRVEGRQTVSAAAFRNMLRVHAEAKGSTGPFGRDGYGLGWLVGSYGGNPLIYHFGSFPGTHSMVSYMPSADLGVAVFANEDVVGVRLTAVISMFVYDWWTGVADPAARATALRVQLTGMLREQGTTRARDPVKLSASDVVRLVGIYRSPQYGTLRIAPGPNGIEVSIGLMRGSALHTDEPGSFDVELIPGRPERFRYETTGGSVRAIRYEEYTVFERV